MVIEDFMVFLIFNGKIIKKTKWDTIKVYSDVYIQKLIQQQNLKP